MAGAALPVLSAQAVPGCPSYRKWRADIGMFVIAHVCRQEFRVASKAVSKPASTAIFGFDFYFLLQREPARSPGLYVFMAFARSGLPCLPTRG